MRQYLNFVKQKIGLIFLVVFLFCLGIMVVSNERKLPGPEVRRAPVTIFSPILRFFGAGQPREVAISPAPTPTPSYTSVMEKTLSYIQNQYRDDGFYNYFADYQKVCKSPSDPNFCPLEEKNMIEVANMWVILARLSFSQNPQELVKAEEDAQALINFCRQDEKKCLLTVVPLAELYNKTQKEEYKQFLGELGSLLLKEDSQKVMQLGYYSRGLTRLYKIFADDQYFIASREMLAKAEAASKANKSKYGRDGEICYLIAAKTEIIETANDRQLKNEVIDFFQKDQEKQVPKQLTLVQPCIESAFRLGQYLNDEKIKVKARQMLDEYVADRGNGAGGFYMAESKDITNITDTAYMVYLMGFVP